MASMGIPMRGKSKKYKQTRKNKGKKPRKIKGHSNKKSRKLMGGTDLCAKVACNRNRGKIIYFGEEYKPTTFTGFCNSGDVNMDNTLQLKQAVGMGVGDIVQILFKFCKDDVKDSDKTPTVADLFDELKQLKDQDPDFKTKACNTFTKLNNYLKEANPCTYKNS